MYTLVFGQKLKILISAKTAYHQKGHIIYQEDQNGVNDSLQEPSSQELCGDKANNP